MKTIHRLFLLASSFAVATIAHSQSKPVEMRFAHWVPAGHAVSKLSFEPWAKSVEAASKGSIKVVLYPAQQLGKAADHYDMARDGIADMTWVSPGYQAGRFPVFAATELPLVISNGDGGSYAVDSWYRKYAASEMKDVKLCLAHVHMGAIHARKAIRTPADFKGMRVRSSSGTLAQTMTLLGATNVQVPAVEARDALDKGIAEALTFPWGSLIAFSIDKAAKFHTDLPIYAGTFVWVMNKKWYDGLDGLQKRVIDDHCSSEWAQKAGAPYAAYEDDGRATLAKTPGHTIVKLEPAQVSEWKKAVEPIAAKWVQDTSKNGVDAKGALDDLKKELTRKASLL